MYIIYIIHIYNAVNNYRTIKKPPLSDPPELLVQAKSPPTTLTRSCVNMNLGRLEQVAIPSGSVSHLLNEKSWTKVSPS